MGWQNGPRVSVQGYNLTARKAEPPAHRALPAAPILLLLVPKIPVCDVCWLRFCPRQPPKRSCSTPKNQQGGCRSSTPSTALPGFRSAQVTLPKTAPESKMQPPAASNHAPTCLGVLPKGPRLHPKPAGGQKPSSEGSRAPPRLLRVATVPLWQQVKALRGGLCSPPFSFKGLKNFF